jgi:hypothetical protein
MQWFCRIDAQFPFEEVYLIVAVLLDAEFS